MKKYIFIAALMSFLLLVIPLTSIKKDVPPAVENAPAVPQSAKSEEKTDYGGYSDFKVLLSESGEVVTMSEAEYIYGVIAAEMPPVYEVNALKAQAVACYTYAYSKRAAERKKPTPELKGADISDSPDTHQGYITDGKAREKWGENYEAYMARITGAVDDVIGQVIIYDGKPILAAYHCISSGKTEDAKVLWGEDIPYLKSVSSPGDMLSPEYKTQVSFSKAEFKETVKKIDGLELQDDSTQWVGKPETSEAGTVISVPIGSTRQSGAKIRELFKLRSANFDIVYKDSTFTFTVYGYGHNAGLSQYGADYMARQGNTYVDILKHYYSGAEIVLKNELKEE